MEKELLIKYVEMINRFEKLSKEERSIYSNTEEEKVMFGKQEEVLKAYVINREN